MQRVFAVGEPPEDKICFFRGLKNVVVLPAVGPASAYLRTCESHVRLYRRIDLAANPDRSLASCLAGGDLDGLVVA